MFIVSPTVARSIAAMDDNLELSMGVDNDANKNENRQPGGKSGGESEEDGREDDPLPPGAPHSTVSDLAAWM